MEINIVRKLRRIESYIPWKDTRYSLKHMFTDENRYKNVFEILSSKVETWSDTQQS